MTNSRHSTRLEPLEIHSDSRIPNQTASPRHNENPLLFAELTPTEVTEYLWRAKAGDEASFVTLLDYLKPYIDKILNARLKSHQCREDTAQEIHIRVYRKLDQYSGAVPFKNWVSRIAANACTDRYHRKKRQSEISFGDLNQEQADYIQSVRSRTDSELHSDQKAAEETITLHLARLNAEDQLVIRLLRLLYLEGLSHREIAVHTGWTESLSKVRAFRARKKLESSIRAAESQAEAKWQAHLNPRAVMSEPTQKAA